MAKVIWRANQVISIETKYKDESRKENVYVLAQMINKAQILVFNQYTFEVQVELIYNVDAVLEKLDNVITSDAIILDKCVSWVNLNANIIGEMNKDYPYIDFSVLQTIENNVRSES